MNNVNDSAIILNKRTSALNCYFFVKFYALELFLENNLQNLSIALADIYVMSRVVFSFLNTLKDFRMQMRRTFLDTFRKKVSRLRDNKSLKYLTITNLTPKHNLLCPKFFN